MSTQKSRGGQTSGVGNLENTATAEVLRPFSVKRPKDIPKTHPGICNKFARLNHLKFYNVPGDGSCQLHAVSILASYLYNKPKFTTTQLRAMICDRMEEETSRWWESFHYETGQDLGDFCNAFRNTNEYGTHQTLIVLAEIYELSIDTYSFHSDNDPNDPNPPNPPNPHQFHQTINPTDDQNRYQDKIILALNQNNLHYGVFVPIGHPQNAAIAIEVKRLNELQGSSEEQRDVEAWEVQDPYESLPTEEAQGSGYVYMEEPNEALQDHDYIRPIYEFTEEPSELQFPYPSNQIPGVTAETEYATSLIVDSEVQSAPTTSKKLAKKTKTSKSSIQRARQSDKKRKKNEREDEDLALTEKRRKIEKERFATNREDEDEEDTENRQKSDKERHSAIRAAKPKHDWREARNTSFIFSSETDKQGPFL